jgi:hypothetical protein
MDSMTIVYVLIGIVVIAVIAFAHKNSAEISFRRAYRRIERTENVHLLQQNTVGVALVWIRDVKKIPPYTNLEDAHIEHIANCSIGVNDPCEAVAQLFKRCTRDNSLQGMTDKEFIIGYFGHLKDNQ